VTANAQLPTTTMCTRVAR